MCAFELGAVVELAPAADARCRVVGPVEVEGADGDEVLTTGAKSGVWLPDVDAPELGGRRLRAECEDERDLACPPGGGAEGSRDCERVLSSRGDGDDEAREEEPRAAPVRRDGPGAEESVGLGSEVLRGGRPPVDMRPDRRGALLAAPRSSYSGSIDEDDDERRGGASMNLNDWLMVVALVSILWPLVNVSFTYLLLIAICHDFGYSYPME